MKERKYEEIDDPVAILDRRLAEGEIDRSEYDELRGTLRSRRSRVLRGSRTLSRSGVAILIVVGVVLAFAVTSVALTYGPWRSSPSGTGTWPWESCCSWGGGQGGMGDSIGGHGNFDVTIASFAYSPQEVRVAVGSTVTWVNMDHVMHTVSFGEHAHEHEDHASIDSGPMYHMGAWSYTFDEPGVYEYHCDPHPYMTGSVMVEG